MERERERERETGKDRETERDAETHGQREAEIKRERMKSGRLVQAWVGAGGSDERRKTRKNRGLMHLEEIKETTKRKLRAGGKRDKERW